MSYLSAEAQSVYSTVPADWAMRIYGWLKCQDVGVGLDFLSSFSDSNSSNVRQTLFSQGCSNLFWNPGKIPISESF